MKSILLPVFCLLAITRVQAQPLTNEALSKKMDEFLLQLVEKKNFSGSVLVARNGQEILKKGYGFASREERVPFTPQTISTVGSVTKQFTATAILKLEMMGKLSVNAALEKFFPAAPADKKKITLHQLLTHTAGFDAAIGDDNETLTRDAFLERAWKTPLKFNPGEQYFYSNVGYSILAAIVELSSGLNYEQFLHKYLFEPAGMKHTGYVLADWKGYTLATGYRGEKLWGKLNEKAWAADGPYWNLKGNGGILSNVEEMYLWHQALLANQVLNAEARQKLYGHYVKEGPDADSYYGYGWAVMPTPRKTWLVTHNGGNGIFFCDVLRYLDEDVVIIYQTNAIKPGLGEVAFQLARFNFVPGYDPLREQAAVVRQFKTMAEAPDGKLAEAFIGVLKNGEEAAMKKFVEENFSPGFLNAASWDQRFPRLKRVGERLKKATMGETITFDGEKIEAAFKSPEGDFTFGIIIDGGKIGGFGVLD